MNCRLLHRRLPLLGALLLVNGTAFALGPLTQMPVRAQSADSRPFPVIEAGMHTATIKRIGVDRAGRWAVTASDDRTARLWDLATGRQVAVLRVPIGDGNEGKLYAAAITPDGNLVAVGGWSGPDGGEKNIFLFDRASGRMLQRLSGLPNVIQHLAFSGDGRWLAAALGGSSGIRVFGRGTGGRWQQVAADTAYATSSYSVDFDAAGRLVATSELDLDTGRSGEVHLYVPPYRGAMKPIARRAVPGGRDPFFARFSPDGSRIAVGFDDTTAVQVVDGRTLMPIGAADTSGIGNGNISSVDWSADGRQLLAAGKYDQGDGTNPLVVWPAAGGPPRQVSLGMTNTVMDLQPLADGRLVYGGGGPAWGVLDRDFRRRITHGPPVLDHRGNLDAFRLSPDGRWLEFRQDRWRAGGWERRLARFDLTRRQLSHPRQPHPNGLAPRTGGLNIQGWADTTRPTLDGRPLSLKEFESSRSVAISANGQRFALGSDWGLQLFDRAGKSRWRTPIPSVAWLVNLSPDGRFVLAALGDGTIRWYRSESGKEALALYVHPDGRRWVLWTPEGFYDAGPGAAELIGYHLNRGRDAAGTFVSSAQLEQHFYRPDLVAARLAGDEAAIAAAVAKVGDVRQVLRASALPPAITLVGRPVRTPDGDTEITYQLEDRGGGIGPIELRLNGAVLEARSNPPVKGINRLRLRLPPGNSKLDLTAYSRSLVASTPVALSVEGSASKEIPTLHLLAVGITAYRDGTLRRGVRFAAGDAQAFAAALASAGRAATARVAPPVVLTDEQATGERIRSELAAVAGRIRAVDLFVLYLAGHGVSGEDGEYTFLPVELLYRNSASLREGLGGEELRNLLSRIPSSKTVVVLDTCSSGSALSALSRSLGEKGAIDRLARLSGRVVLAAAGDQQMALALEDPNRKRGIFTGALLEGLAGGADANRDGQVGVREVADFVEAEVQRITTELFGYEQTPMSDLRGQNFPLSRTRSVR